MVTATTDGMVGSLSCTTIPNPFRRGQQMRIPAGMPMRSTHPRRRGVYLAKRAISVTVFSAYDGYVDLWDDARMGRGYLHLPSVTYPGSGGYWVDIKVTPEFAWFNGLDAPRLPVLSDHDRTRLDVEPGFGPGYDNRD